MSVIAWAKMFDLLESCVFGGTGVIAWAKMFDWLENTFFHGCVLACSFTGHAVTAPKKAFKKT